MKVTHLRAGNLKKIRGKLLESLVKFSPIIGFGVLVIGLHALMDVAVHLDPDMVGHKEFTDPRLLAFWVVLLDFAFPALISYWKTREYHEYALAIWVGVFCAILPDILQTWRDAYKTYGAVPYVLRVISRHHMRLHRWKIVMHHDLAVMLGLASLLSFWFLCWYFMPTKRAQAAPQPAATT